ncbi:MAG: transglycosylase domain-containing protein [Saprospiraceae bacterium]|nr:transglycosylase domain-containing protein [Saprospiraceae bacterium]
MARPAQKKKSAPRISPRMRNALRYTMYAGLAGLGLVLLLIAGIFWGWFGDLPSRNVLAHIRQHQASEVLSADGVILGKYYLENRVIVDNDRISPWVTKALVATEDSRFFEHRGIDWISLGRVFFRTFLGRDVSQGGGSTLSQQLAKNLYPRKDHGWLSIPVNKIREMIIALRLEKAYPKEDLLNLYLNTVPFGDNLFGIEVASRRYFGKAARDLEAQEAALLVGMLKGNSLYHPVRNPKRALERRNTVLNRMQNRNNLTPAECTQMKELPLGIHYTRENHNEGLATYFREHLRFEIDSLLQDMRKPDGTRYNLYTDGLRIKTTINSRLQRYAEEAMKKHMVVLQSAFDREWKGGKPWGSDAILDQAMRSSDRWHNGKKDGLSDKELEAMFLQKVNMRIFTWQGPARREWTPRDSLRYALSLLHTGLVSGDPVEGRIMAWVGGIDQQFFQYDHVLARRQVGSTFKPIVYAAALEAGFMPCDYFDNQLVTYPDHQDWEPRNASNEYGGVYSMAGALSKSLNTISASLIMETGVEPVIDMARRCGLNGRIPEVPSIALGTGEASPLELLSLFGTVALDGIRPHWYYLEQIETASGEVLYTYTQEENQALYERAMNPETAMILRNALEMAVDSGTARALRYTYGLTGPMAGKTGTTQDQADGWFAGFNPRLVTSVWVGAELPVVHFKSLAIGSGGRSAMPVFARMMQAAVKDESLRAIVKTPFAPIPEYVAASLDCPPYLPEAPIYADDDPGLLEWLGLKDREEQIADADQAKRSPSEASERIRKRNERMLKKRERKQSWNDFWDGVFKRD